MNSKRALWRAHQREQSPPTGLDQHDQQRSHRVDDQGYADPGATATGSRTRARATGGRRRSRTTIRSKLCTVTGSQQRILARSVGERQRRPAQGRELTRPHSPWAWRTRADRRSVVQQYKREAREPHGMSRIASAVGPDRPHRHPCCRPYSTTNTITSSRPDNRVALAKRRRHRCRPPLLAPHQEQHGATLSSTNSIRYTRH